MKRTTRSLVLSLVASLGLTQSAQTSAIADANPPAASVNAPAAQVNAPPTAGKKEEKPSAYSIKAAIPNHPRQVIKFGKQFVLLDETGMAPEDSPYGFGLYKDDTRYLNQWNVTINRAPLTLLYSNTDDGYAAHYVYCNSQGGKAGGFLPGELALVERDVLINDRMREHYKVTNCSPLDRTFLLGFHFGADFADMFEVRGAHRAKRGELMTPELSPLGDGVTLGYRGLDDQLMQTLIGFSQKPLTMSPDEVTFQVVLKPHQSWEFETSIVTGLNDSKLKPFVAGSTFTDEKKVLDQGYADWRKQGATIVSDNETFNRWLEKGFRDLYILRQPTPKGECVAAGVPWFSVAFGRDQEITSLETLPFLPSLTKDVLDVLAAYQGTKDDAFTEEHPGRIMHELRLGEMARLKEIPFIPYYGTVDATPMYVVLMGRYLRTTGDIAFVKAHWDNVSRALEYLDGQSKDGYLRYGFDKKAALSNQGWKDSFDSVMYANGELAKPPIALCEAQGYLYQAYRSAADIADHLSMPDEAHKWNAKADDLKTRFQKDFWNDKLGFVALALDGDGKQCEVVSSNPGHLLSSGILTSEQAQAVADRLMKDDMYSGWGIRTLSNKEVHYNPFSYHDGSIWPHDNAMISMGFGACKRTDLAATVLASMFKVAQSQPDLRLPELFCGFPNTYAEKPLWYPVSCSPQAWAAGSALMMLQGTLGLSVDGDKHEVSVRAARLPEGVSRLEIKGLPVGEGRTDLKFHREDTGTVCDAKAGPGVSSSIEASQ